MEDNKECCDVEASGKSAARKVLLGKLIFLVSAIVCSWIIWFVYTPPPGSGAAGGH
ncbi:MAG: hypothetical protein AAB300_03515 [Nitrospirota bacterium]